MMFEYKINAMCNGCASYAQENAQDDVWYKIKAMRKGCTSYAQENAQDDFWV